jgi:hypothetical protein
MYNPWTVKCYCLAIIHSASKCLGFGEVLRQSTECTFHCLRDEVIIPFCGFSLLSELVSKVELGEDL